MVFNIKDYIFIGLIIILGGTCATLFYINKNKDLKILQLQNDIATQNTAIATHKANNERLEKDLKARKELVNSDFANVKKPSVAPLPTSSKDDCKEFALTLLKGYYK